MIISWRWILTLRCKGLRMIEVREREVLKIIIYVDRFVEFLGFREKIL